MAGSKKAGKQTKVKDLKPRKATASKVKGGTPVQELKNTLNALKGQRPRD